jgi:hypothetical protein
MPTETIRPVGPALTANDRCDACGARASVRVWMPGDLDLLFCNHHYQKNEPALIAQGAIPETRDNG